MKEPFDPQELGFNGKPHALYDERPSRIVCNDLGRTWSDNLDFLTTTPGAKFDSDFRATITLAFDEGGISGRPVIAILQDMRALVERLLLTFEKRFFLDGQADQ